MYIRTPIETIYIPILLHCYKFFYQSKRQKKNMFDVFLRLVELPTPLAIKCFTFQFHSLYPYSTTLLQFFFINPKDKENNMFDVFLKSIERPTSLAIKHLTFQFHQQRKLLVSQTTSYPTVSFW